ncbi:MAG: MlaE family lipid ABC transporter permease subunit [Myxococcales bacterium]|nr:MlaE family lipid ABC transporter permease subunit [Myxococcales bacterium]
MSAGASSTARLDLRQDGTAVLSGSWTTRGLARSQTRAERLPWSSGASVRIDASALDGLDTSGAQRILELQNTLADAGLEFELVGLSESQQDLFDLVLERLDAMGTAEKPRRVMWPEALGRAAFAKAQDATTLIAFIGETAVGMGRSLVQPSRIRWKELVSVIENAGVRSMAIVGLLSFLLGIVIAYQGGITLRQYGANVFIVELVTITMFRELAPLITSIIIAGRTGSAFTAQIGTMKVTEEVDALETLGIRPMDMLVIPKVVGLMIALPLLTLFAMATGVFGGMVMADLALGISYADFLQRVPDAVSPANYFVGVGKTPVFAAIIAIVGCYQGLQVSGGAESVGRQTTTSVVQSIFLIIVADAAFSVIFSMLGI